MKTLVRRLFIMAFASLPVACSESLQVDEKMAGMELKSAPGDEEMVFTVYPTGDDDTPNLKQAFDDAIVAGSGSVVQLAEGIYHLNFIEIREFFGTFRGAGKGKTVITTVPDLSVDALLSQSLHTILIVFVGGNVHISDMTIKTPPGPLSTGSISGIDGLLGIFARTFQYTSENEYINAVINHVEFIGNRDNTNKGIHAGYDILDNRTDVRWPLSFMDISITNCSFDNFINFGALVELVKGGKIVAGTKQNGNIFRNNSTLGWSTGGSLGFWCNVNVDITVEGNTFFVPPGTRYGIELFSSPIPRYLEQVAQTKGTVCNIEQNEFYNSGGFGGMIINDRRRYFYPEDLPLVVQVKNNRFNLSNDANSGITCNNTYGMIIRNNRFDGNGQYGVRIWGDSPYPYNENGLMLGNNFSNTSFSVASVLFEARTKNWTIVGGNLGESVWDKTLGAGNHIITGMNVNVSDVPLGQTIVDNF